MKKILIIILILLLLIASFFGYNYLFSEKGIPILETEEEEVIISKYYIYGTHLNLIGSLEITDTNFEEIYLTLYDGEFKDYDINYTNQSNSISFNISDEVNNGIYLDDLPRGNYYAFIKLVYENEEDAENPIEKYYILDNQTEYNDTIYYTFSKYNNKIVINSDNDYKTMMLNINEKKDSVKVADIVLDPGHGGMDGGAEAFGYSERDFTYKLAKSIQESLENKGYNVFLTRNELPQNELLDEYNEGGRAVISSEVYAKYLLSIHFNSNSVSSVNGLEIYSPSNINYDFVNALAKNITSMTGLEYSSQKTFKLYNGVYCHNFSEYEIENSLKGYEEKNYNPYNITTDSNYYYMIRETGGIITGAYVDDSNPEKVGVNPYYNSNRGTESYVLELGYITNSNDFDIISNKQTEFTDAIVKTFEENLLK